MTVRRVPLAQGGKALLDSHDEVVRELERYLVWHSLNAATEHAIQIGPRDTGKATFGLNPSAGEPVALMHKDRPAFPAPDVASRMLPLLPRFGDGTHGYLTYHALDSRGVFDYAGIKLEAGYSPQATNGVLGPTKQFIESQGDAIAAEAVRDTLRAVGG